METEKDKAVYLARGVFSEWLNIKLGSDLWHKRGRPVYEELLKSAKTGSLRMFREYTPSRLIEMFKLKKDVETDMGPKKMIEQELRGLLEKSAILIREFVESKWAPPARFDHPTSRLVNPYFTNLWIGKDELPWANEIPWDSDSTPADAAEEASDDD